MKRGFLVLVVVLGSIAPGSGAQNTASAPRWLKGQLHAHTIRSDGDSSPYDVMGWYKRNGYQFLAITDHNTFTDPAFFGIDRADPRFLLIGGEEVSTMDVHVNAIGIGRTIGIQTGATATDLLQASIDAVRAQGGIPLINHPNFQWALTTADMLPLKRVGLLEIAGLPVSNHAGNGRSPSTEEMWDQLLTAGMRVFAVAVDDAHRFQQAFDFNASHPGRGWVMVRAGSLSRESILAALGAGDFYASTGVTLQDIRATARSYTVDVQIETQANPPTPRRYRVVFIGKEGRVLGVSYENPATYALSGAEGYVRARIEDSGGRRAWTQPVFVPAGR